MLGDDFVSIFKFTKYDYENPKDIAIKIFEEIDKLIRERIPEEGLVSNTFSLASVAYQAELYEDNPIRDIINDMVGANICRELQLVKFFEDFLAAKFTSVEKTYIPISAEDFSNYGMKIRSRLERVVFNVDIDTLAQSNAIKIEKDKIKYFGNPELIAESLKDYITQSCNSDASVLLYIFYYHPDLVMELYDMMKEVDRIVKTVTIDTDNTLIFNKLKYFLDRVNTEMCDCEQQLGNIDPKILSKFITHLRNIVVNVFFKNVFSCWPKVKIMLDKNETSECYSFNLIIDLTIHCEIQ